MTKKEFAARKKMDEMDQYATIARILEKEEDSYDMWRALRALDDKCFAWAESLGCSDEWMGIYSGLMCVIDVIEEMENEENEDDEEDDQ